MSFLFRAERNDLNQTPALETMTGDQKKGVG